MPGEYGDLPHLLGTSDSWDITCQCSLCAVGKLEWNRMLFNGYLTANKCMDYRVSQTVGTGKELKDRVFQIFYFTYGETELQRGEDLGYPFCWSLWNSLDFLNRICQCLYVELISKYTFEMYFIPQKFIFHCIATGKQEPKEWEKS